MIKNKNKNKTKLFIADGGWDVNLVSSFHNSNIMKNNYMN